MLYAKYVGRVGALAVALGVGMAVASTPGIAYALPSDSGSVSSSTDGSSAPAGAASSDKSDSTDSSASDPKPPSGPADAQPKSIADTKDAAADKDAAAADDAKEAGGAEEASVSDGDGEDAPPAVGHEDAVSGDSASEPVSSKPAGGRHARALTQPDASGDVESSVAAAGQSARSGGQVQTLTVDAVADVPTRRTLVAPASAGLLTTVSAAVVAPAPPQPGLEDVLEEPHTFLVGVVAHLVNAVLTPLLGLVGPGMPAQSPLLWTLLAFARNEFEQFSFPNLARDPATPTLVLGPNLLVNPGAELGDPSLSGYAAVTVPGWELTGTPTVIKYGTERRFPVPTPSPGPVLPGFLAFPSSDGPIPAASGGQQFFGGGPVADSTLTQTVDLRPAQGSIDAGNGRFTLSGDLGGFFIDPSRTSVTVNFLDANGVGLGAANLEPVTAWDRLFATGFIHRDVSGAIPTLTRSAQVVVTLDDRNPVLGNYNNAYADNLSFTVNDSALVPATLAPPASNVGDLDHVFMVYLENKGVTQIIGSPNAPYINSLINNYGYASNYYGLSHPSDPNYYPIVGGSDFGFNYNCPAQCFPADTPNLADRIEAAGMDWAGYMEGGGGYTTPNDRLPFLAFSDIYDDPDRVATHLFDISEMEQDLADPATAPEFVWFAADDATNMEGPTDFPFGILNWALGFIDPSHQYNVKAGDEWLQEQLATIMDSPTWQDPTQKSAIFVTFDEDYNNITTGVGNEGNHIVMIVIPSQGAVDNGMREGHFIADDHNNHYSLLRTIEDSLGLLPLTNNDEFAQPMNEFWEAQDPQSSGNLVV